jgi:hypothetical protein
MDRSLLVLFHSAQTRFPYTFQKRLHILSFPSTTLFQPNPCRIHDNIDNIDNSSSKYAASIILQFSSASENRALVTTNTIRTKHLIIIRQIVAFYSNTL